MNMRDAALDEIAALAAEHNLTLDDIGARLTAGYEKDKGGKWLSRVFGYLGAVFIFGGLALFIGMRWSELNSPARVIITYGPGLFAFIMGIVATTDARYKNASTALFIKSAILQPIGMFTFLHEYAHGNDPQLAALLVFGISAAQFLIAFLAVPRTALLFFGYLFWNEAIGILCTRIGVPGDTLGIVLGMSMLCVAWSLDRTPHRPVAPLWYFLGGVGLLGALFDTVRGAPYDVIYLAFAAGIMMLSVRVHSRTMLAVGTVALLGFLSYFTEKHFAHVIGWPIALMIMGLLLVGISAYAVKLGRRMTAPY